VIGGGGSSSAPAPRAVLADQLAKEQRALPARIALIAVGFLLIAWLMVSLVLVQTRGSEKRTSTHPASTSTTSMTTTTPAVAASPATTTSPATAATPASTTTSSKTSTSAGGAKETNDSAPSDTILMGLLTSGAVLILAGALYTRLTTIKLGGAEIAISPEESAAVAAGVAAHADPHATPEQVAHATVLAINAAQASKVPGSDTVGLTREAVEEAALTGVHEAGAAPAAPVGQVPPE